MATATTGEEYKLLHSTPKLVKTAKLFSLIWILAVTAPALYFVSQHAESLKEYIAGYLANVCINVLSVAAALVLIYIVVKVVINALHLFSKLPGLNFLNRFSGVLVGGAKGIVCVWLAGIVLTFFQCKGTFAELFSAMERTLFAGYFYENNILLQLILTIFT